jgi:NAD+ diphosphatase
MSIRDDSASPFSGDKLIVIVHGTDVLVEDSAGAPVLPPAALVEPILKQLTNVPGAGSGVEAIALGRYDGCDCFGAGASAALRAAPPAGLRFVPVRALLGGLHEAVMGVVGRAIALVEFEGLHRVCGRFAAASRGPANARGAAPPAARPFTRAFPRR